MCGVVGVYGCENNTKEEVVGKFLELLEGSKNRGQDGYGAGILGENGKLTRIVSKTTDGIKKALLEYQGKILAIIGHARYTTSGGTEAGEKALQPFQIEYEEKVNDVLIKAGIIFSFNGNIVNADELAGELMLEGYKFEHEPILDTEVLKVMILQQVKKGITDIQKILEYIFDKIEGCCNMIILDNKGNMAISKDRHGYRPFAYGMMENGIFLTASESKTVLDADPTLDPDPKSKERSIHFLKSARFVRIKQGSQKPRMSKLHITKPVEKQHCFFEAVYFADPRTILWGIKASEYRKRFGEMLGEEDVNMPNKENTVLVDVPSSSEFAAEGYAEKTGIKRFRAIKKRPGAKRTFITIDDERMIQVEEKYDFDPDLIPDIEGKTVVLMDDSIVRGTTLKHLVQKFKEFYRPAKVIIRIPSPSTVAPCFYGISMANVKELIAAQYFEDINNPTEKELKALARYFGATDLRFLSREKLIRSLGMEEEDTCLSCVTGKYLGACAKAQYAESKHRDLLRIIRGDFDEAELEEEDLLLAA